MSGGLRDMRTNTTKIMMVVVLVTLLGAACTSSASPTTTSEAPPSTTTVPPTTTTTLAPTTTTATVTPALLPPTTRDTSDVAADAFRFQEGFTVVLDPTAEDSELTASIDGWMPFVIVDGAAAAIFADDNDNRIAVVSIIPLSGLRANPYVSYHFATAVDPDVGVPDEADGVLEVESADGETFYLWSEGDGVMIAVSDDNDAARRYLEARRDIDEPNPVWATGDCLYIPQDQPDFYGRMPYAPFALDQVVPCIGPHNAEVLLSEFTGTDLDEFDGLEIAYLRSYRCDEVYTEEFGRSQEEYLPSMITYMPDVDEFDRGDRYLACVVILDDVGDTEVLFAGRMADLTDLDWVLEVGACSATSSKFELSCDAVHSLQFLGSVTVEFETYPSFDSTDFDDACEVFGSGLVEGTATDAEIRIISGRIQPYQFELGARTVHCFAGAVVGGFAVEVVGSFFEKWSEVDENADAA
jgi:hypothetical protein